MSQEPSLTEQIQALIQRYQSQLSEREDEIRRLEADLMILSRAPFEKGVIREAPESEGFKSVI